MAVIKIMKIFSISDSASIAEDDSFIGCTIAYSMISIIIPVMMGINNILSKSTFFLLDIGK